MPYYVHTYNPVTGDYVATTAEYSYKPSNSTSTPLPPRPWGGVWPQWDGEKWLLREDHRSRKAHEFQVDEVQEATDYWLPGDTYETPARHMVTTGPLPEGALLEKPAKSGEELFASLRAERDRRITETDYMAMPDYPLTDAVRKKLLVYRQALRDLPSQEGAPWDGGGELAPWPVKP